MGEVEFIKTGEILKGLSVSTGVGIGEVFKLKIAKEPVFSSVFTSVEEEIRRLQQAVDCFCYRTYGVFQKMRSLLGQEDALILGGQIFMARDLEFMDELHQEIATGITAEEAVMKVFTLYLSYFQDMEDEVMSQRGADLSDMRDSILEYLTGQYVELPFEHKKNLILCAEELSPSIMAEITPESVAGILCQKGGVTSHCAILARATGIPAIFGVSNLMEKVVTGEQVVVDGSTGLAVRNPLPTIVLKYEEKSKSFQLKRKELERFRNLNTKNASGDAVELLVNISDFGQVHTAIEMGADGVGLFRTEYLFMERYDLPTEEEQVRAFSRMASMMEGKTVTIRTLDIGGDKEAPCLPQELENNPFLGLRAIRYCLCHREIFKTQLRAILRTAGEYSNISILVPFVTEIQEFIQVKLLLEECKDELIAENYRIPAKIPFGVVVETPSAAIMIDRVLDYVDFISIGTNDMTQYIMACDRGNARVAEYYNVFHLSVLRILKFIIATCNKRKVPVTLCGEAVGDPRFIPVLLGFGKVSLSVSPTSVLGVRRELTLWNTSQAVEVAQAVLKMSKTEDIVKYLNEQVAANDNSPSLIAN